MWTSPFRTQMIGVPMQSDHYMGIATSVSSDNGKTWGEPAHHFRYGHVHQSFLNLADGRILHTVEGFEDGQDVLLGWDTLAEPECLVVDDERPHHGRRSLRLLSGTDACNGRQGLEQPLPCTDCPVEVAAWFYDDGVADGTLRLQLVVDEGSSHKIGLDPDWDTARYALRVSGGVTSRRVWRSRGWHRAELRRTREGRVLGSIDGVPLGAGDAAGAGFLRVTVHGTTAWLDDVVVLREDP